MFDVVMAFTIGIGKLVLLPSIPIRKKMAMGASTIDAEQRLHALNDEDRRLLDQVTDVLADPGLQDEQRASLRRGIHELLRTTHETVYHSAVHQVHGAAPHELREPSMLEHDPHTTKLLEAVLVDPNLNTDRRMRLYHEIPQLFRTAHDHEGAS